MKSASLLILLLILIGLAAAEPPPEYPELVDLPETYTVILKGREVPNVVWRNGRPHGHRQEVGPRLNLSADGDPMVDIIAAAKRKGYVAKFDGEALILSERSGASPSGPAPTGARPQQPSQPSGPRPAKLVAKTEKFVAETGFVRAIVTVTNTGGSPSEPQLLICRFVDWYGKTLAEDKSTVPSLQPGESASGMTFSFQAGRQGGGGAVHGSLEEMATADRTDKMQVKVELRPLR